MALDLTAHAGAPVRDPPPVGPQPAGKSRRDLTAVALIAGLPALIFYYQGLCSTSASLASIDELAFPLPAVTADWHLLGSRLTVPQILGACIPVAAVTLLTFPESTSSAPPQARPEGGTPGEGAA